MPYNLFGTSVVTCGADDHAAIGAAVMIGDQMRRPPIAVVRIVERLADGSRSYLTHAERDALNLVNMPLQLGTDGRFAAKVPVKVSMYFKPSR